MVVADQLKSQLSEPAPNLATRDGTCGTKVRPCAKRACKRVIDCLGDDSDDSTYSLPLPEFYPGGGGLVAGN